MNGSRLTTYVLIVIGLMLAPVARAQTQPRGFVYNLNSLALTTAGQTFPVTAKVLADWQGQTLWYSGSPLQEPPPDLNQNLSAFFGLTPVTPAPVVRTFHYRVEKIYDYLQTVLASTTNQTIIEPRLTIENGRVADFTPPQTGQELDVYQSALNIIQGLEQAQPKIPLIINQIAPTKNLADTNSLGINELVAEGVSSFKGSPQNRRFNIAVGVEKMKGVLVAPGATFSFDDNLGPVDGEHGFLPELVIDNGNTLPEFGGGLCQVSTTTFRAAMAAGVPITARRNHAYAVQYYSPQGTDATIYPGSADLKFINDTPGTILIWPYEKDKNTLVFDFYGTKDGRQVTLEKPVITDRQPDGSMKASWTRDVVTAAGVSRSDVFKSVYQSPALFHKTETFVSATGTPSSGLPMPTKIQ